MAKVVHKAIIFRARLSVLPILFLLLRLPLCSALRPPLLLRLRPFLHPSTRLRLRHSLAPLRLPLNPISRHIQ